jgi:alpha-mannosidase
VHDDRHIVEQRITKFLSHVVRPALYGAPLTLDLAARHVPGEPVPVRRPRAGPR